MKAIWMLLLLITAGCSGVNDSVPEIEVDFNNLEDASSIISSVEKQVELDCADCAIGEITKAVTADGIIFLMDDRRSEIMSFNAETGAFQSRISRKGRAKGEYPEITDFDVSGHFIYILSSPLQKVLKYSFDGQFVREYPIGDWFVYIKCDETTESFILAGQNTSQGKYNVVRYSSEDGAMAGRYDKFKNYSGYFIGSVRPFSRKSDHVLISKVFDRTVYRLENGHFSPFLKIAPKGIECVSDTELESGDYKSISDNYKKSDYFKYVSFPSDAAHKFTCTVTRSLKCIALNYLLSADIDSGSCHLVNLAFSKYEQFPYLSGCQVLELDYDRMVTLARSPELNGRNPIIVSYRLR